MSKRNGDKARSNRQQKQKMLQRKHSRELGKPSKYMAMVPSPVKDGGQIVSSRLRQLIVDGKADPSALEIVVQHAPQGGQND